MIAESAPWWRPLLRRRLSRKASCIAAGTHRPQLIDMGRAKLCFRCGTW